MKLLQALQIAVAIISIVKQKDSIDISSLANFLSKVLSVSDEEASLIQQLIALLIGKQE